MDTIQCPQCGTVNDSGRALCINCQTPLTAYSGELRGEAYDGKLAAQVEKLRVRPLGVNLMAAFLLLIAVAWPLRTIVTSFVTRAHLNGDATNYIASAFSTVGPLLITIVCLPIAVCLVWIAWSAVTQQARAWQLCLGAISVFGIFILFRAGVYRGWTILWLGLVASLIAVWIREPIKTWFGKS